MGDREEERRAMAKFHPNIWAERFISFTSSSLSNSRHDSYYTEIQLLKQKVKDDMLLKSSSWVEKITLINILCRLGLSYHFEEEVEQELKRIFDDDAERNSWTSQEQYDLYTRALVFRVLRQHGYMISCEIFNRFMDGEGRLIKESIDESDVRGMLSLYEASQLRVHGEAILDQALVFTTTRLESIVQDSPNHSLADQVVYALQQPLHKDIARLEARRFISIYEQDQTRDETLLKFAKLDFNFLQLLHQQELGIIQRWWKESKIMTKLVYARDRIVELYFWMSGVYYEPHYSQARIILTKIVALVSITDDTIDAYATFEEIKLLNNAILRWEYGAVEQLPEYMHVLYKTMLSVYEEIEEEVTNEGRSFVINYAKEAFKEVVSGYYQEAEWLNQKYTPNFEEYMENALTSSACYTLALSSLVGMKSAGRQEFDWIQTKPKCVRACQTIGRLANDIIGHKEEQERNHIPSAVECYMIEYGVSEEKSVAELRVIIEDAWKDMNQELLSSNMVAMPILMRVLNLTRTMDVVYKSHESYTNAEAAMKTSINLLFVDPIFIDR